MKNIRNTGIKKVTKLQKVYLDGSPVLDSQGRIITKYNHSSDPDYIPPSEDFFNCPTEDSEIILPEEDGECSLENVYFLPVNGHLVDNEYSFIIGVNDKSKIYEFKNPITLQWNESTIGNNKTSYSVNANLDSVLIKVRKKGCFVEKELIVTIPDLPIITPNLTEIVFSDCQNVNWIDVSPPVYMCGKYLGDNYNDCTVYKKQYNNCDDNYKWIVATELNSNTHSNMCNC